MRYINKLIYIIFIDILEVNLVTTVENYKINNVD